jgi:hypothetical protein
MKFEMLYNFWTNNYKSVEISFKINGRLFYNAFLTQDEVFSLGQQFVELQQELMEIGNRMVEE